MKTNKKSSLNVGIYWMMCFEIKKKSGLYDCDFKTTKTVLFLFTSIGTLKFYLF